jgi:hypothetical protein
MYADHIPKKEWGWTLACASVIVALSCLPYLIAWIATPPGYQFGGILVNPFDGNSYLAKMRQGWAGSWQFHLTYTPEPHDGAPIIYFFYLGLGHVARWTGLPLILVYHAARLLGGLALLTTTFVFLARLTRDRREGRLAFWLVGTSAGLGWLGAALGAYPIDLWVPEAFAFFSLLTNPHFPLAMALMLVIVASVIWPVRSLGRGLSQNSTEPGATPREGFAPHFASALHLKSGTYSLWCWLVPGLAALGLVLVHPLGLIPVYVTLALYLLLRRWLDLVWPMAELLAAAGSVLFSVPVLLYGYWIYVTNPAMAGWAAQNLTPAPRVLDLALGYGLVGLLAILGGVIVIRKRDRGGLALLAWSVGTLVLVYMPFPLQRRLLTGLGVPLSVLAGIGLNRWWLSRLTAERARLIAAATVGFSLLGNLFLLLVLSLGVLKSDRQADPFARLYLTQDEVNAMQWLLAHAQGEVVLASPRTGALLPGRAGVRVFAGHPYETINAKVKQAQAEAFFRDELSDDEWQGLQDRYHIRFVFVGPTERALGGGAYLGEMEPAFRVGEVTIYRSRTGF